MGIDEIAEKSAASTFLEGFMIEDGDNKVVDRDAWRATLEDDENIRRLAVGALIVSEMREAVLKETQFTCSAGVAHNKVSLIFPCHSQIFLIPHSNSWLLHSTSS